ncbi:carbohydrate ABC transporter permease [Streptomyces sp. H39-S7]|uniref:carbohydrate ABC transporter permease n=1 Tax=Streptomyces sp. H39-S7 TaxID=3004357 RepID=UPI0022AF65DF|nr:sugar ABC transporter permease [Streptomyces sp. H39-S7]MCZ4125516.1 sugar ABC transporter permease [Streptomyces sp. H39-S7]
MVAPLAYAVNLSLFTERSSGLGFGSSEKVFNAPGNYWQALTSEHFQNGFATLALYCVVYIPVMVGLAALFALLIDATTVRAGKFFQLTLFLPHAVPEVIAGLIWAYLYTPGVSPVLGVLSGRGIDIDMLGRSWVLPGVINIAVWMWTGYNMVILYTALKAIPHETLEAARVDGAGGWTIATRIKLPMIRQAIGVVILFTVIGSLQMFNSPMVMRSAGSALDADYSPAMFIYHTAFGANDIGLAAAASILLAAAAGVLSWTVTRIAGRKESW